MRPEPTSKQQDVLAYLEAEIARTGSPPSLRRAAVALGVSHAAVAQSIRGLEEKGYLRRDGRYSRRIFLLNRAREPASLHRWEEIPIIGRITAGLPMYAQQQWDGTLIVDRARLRGQNLFALQVRGDSMKNAGILDGDLAVCEPRQYAESGEIVAALVGGEEATVKRFFLRKDHIELQPENPAYPTLRYGFGEVLVQGKVVGVWRGPESIK